MAIAYVGQGEDNIKGIAYLLIVVGAIIAGIVTRSNAEMGRAHYFAYGMLILFLSSFVELVWLFSVPAIIGGYLWVFVALSFLAYLVSGFFGCRAAIARSRDAFGHGRRAFLAFIPIASLWLLFKESQQPASPNKMPTIAIFSGGLGVVTGFVLLAATVWVTVFLQEQAQAMSQQQAQNNPDAERAGVDLLIGSKGLEGALRAMAAAANTPIKVDEITSISKIEAIGMQLQRTYTVDGENMAMPETLRSRHREQICASSFVSIFRAGGSLREVYVEKSGREIGEVMVTAKDCDH